jgi:predicted RecB family nuclease
MSFAASEYHNYYQLKPCALRVYLGAKGEPDAYHQLLAKLGQRHEQRQLRRFGVYFDARGDVQETIQAVARGETIIYQPEMKAIHPDHCDVVGRPDFFIEDNGYVIGDCKLSRRFNENDHPEIFRQLQLYGWLYERTFGVAPIRIEAYILHAWSQNFFLRVIPRSFTRNPRIRNVRQARHKPAPRPRVR